MQAKTFHITRRATGLGMAAALLAGCMGGVLPATTRRAEDPAMRPVPNPAFDAWLAAFRPRARSRGISEATLDRALSSAGYLPGVIERDRNQAEFRRTLEDYLALVASEARVSEGRAAARQHASLLSEIESRYGVESHIIAAIWGVESRYGQRRGDIPVISATATLAFDGRRGQMFENQLMAALRIIQNGDTSPANMVGSWAGAMGHTQFIPTTFAEYAVDFRGTGQRDIWSDDPTDALASAAAYLSRMGWRRGQPWGFEVRLPEGFPTSALGRSSTRSRSDWAGMGVVRADGSALPDHGPASIIAPMGVGTPAFMTFANFTTITRYNNSESYVIGVGYLADRIRGGGPLRTPFPPDRFGLTQDDRMDLQRRLTAAGFDTGGADGVLGPNTERAIRDFQRARGLSQTGEPSRAMLDMLRGRG
ncbi:lytic murein transglycosylase [Rhodobacteraceae bacterium 2376]|uniref:Lytic murein transglycosylase n=1 Tax=Rhabdonatronobacter sediminivivens TaxID=2743469 RepID=A0A7Z0HWK6_9RHOB|nr:lytic murein transglycosylase [Rhabdonatronobacter sediminivivens]NYS23372.1 lytic murein transglycosylase [Rhabdonatronobacter sediminivivens]